MALNFKSKNSDDSRECNQEVKQRTDHKSQTENVKSNNSTEINRDASNNYKFCVYVHMFGNEAKPLQYFFNYSVCFF